MLTAKKCIKTVSDFNPKYLEAKIGGGGVRSLRIYWGKGSQRVDLSEARVPIRVPLLPFAGTPLLPKSQEKHMAWIWSAHILLD